MMSSLSQIYAICAIQIGFLIRKLKYSHRYNSSPIFFDTHFIYCSLVFIETIEEQATDEEASRICLSDKMSLELAKLAVKLEAIFRNARDIEFAIKDVSNIL